MQEYLNDLVSPGAFFWAAAAGLFATVVLLCVRNVRRGKCPFNFASASEPNLSVTVAPVVSSTSAPPAMDRPLQQSDPVNAAFLQDLQGNILNGHGRDHVSNVLVSFRSDCQNEARLWLSRFAEKHVSSAYQQFRAARMFKLHGHASDIFGHVAISAAGYNALGISSAKQPKGLNPRKHEDGKGYVEVFGKGMKSRRAELADTPVDAWDEAYQREIHLLIILAGDDREQLDVVEREVAESLAGLASVSVERGMGLTQLLDPKDEKTRAHIEHFGFVDGRSQPLVLQEQVDLERANGGTSKWDPSAPLQLVLAPDPLGQPGFSHGSFLVYRKLEQNVRGFNRAMRDLARALNVPEELARAMTMGRFQDGTPVVNSDKSGTTNVPNDFGFADDAEGLKCPLHAHIRKANPRNSSEKRDERRHRIARRGIPYGGELVDSRGPLEDMPETGRGLLFLCYQADIFEQFEFIQRVWANFGNFPKPDTGVDPVIGQTSAGYGEAAKKWPSGWGKPLVNPGIDIAGFVKMKGGEYFFSPSLSFLKKPEA